MDSSTLHRPPVIMCFWLRVWDRSHNHGYCCTLNSLSLLWLAECVLIRNQRLWGHLTAHVNGTQSHRWSCYAWCKVCALFVACRQWKSKNLTIFLVQWIIKHLIDLVFVIFRETEVLVSVISLSFWLQLITPTLTLIILDIIKTSFNNIV